MTFKAKIGISISVKPVVIGELPRSEKKNRLEFSIIGTDGKTDMRF